MIGNEKAGGSPWRRGCLGDCRPQVAEGIGDALGALEGVEGHGLENLAARLMVCLTAWDAVETVSPERQIGLRCLQAFDQEAVTSANLYDIMDFVDAPLHKTAATRPKRIFAVCAVTCTPPAHATRPFHRATAAPIRYSAMSAWAYGSSACMVPSRQAACELSEVSCSIAVLTAIRSRELGVSSPLSQRETVAWFTPIFAAMAACESPRRLRSDAMSITPTHICAFA